MASTDIVARLKLNAQGFTSELGKSLGNLPDASIPVRLDPATGAALTIDEPRLAERLAGRTAEAEESLKGSFGDDIAYYTESIKATPAAAREILGGMLGDGGAALLERMRSEPVIPPGKADVAFADGRFPTASGRIEFASDEAARLWGVDPVPDYAPLPEGHAGALALRVGVGHALEHFEALQRGLAALDLVRKHAAYGAPEEAGGGLEVVGAGAAGVLVVGLAQELHVVGLAAEERTRHGDLLHPHHDDALAAEQLLGDVGGEAAHDVSLGVDHDLFFEHQVIYKK